MRVRIWQRPRDETVEIDEASSDRTGIFTGQAVAERSFIPANEIVEVFVGNEHDALSVMHQIECCTAADYRDNR
ncbi:hypothetical protein [Sphingomonas sp. SUN039]|uniref:hypothetical protein n=1 Tax=Sphingomonas sp. SUN039 TaxID=2937787 RepID=UPI002164AAB3|nr:hypothetical protein [Sphingomonas sp. SUN039]UVO53063.1 hypothetical protein M0209_02610 [Sphingomonas sp. SUN039]